MEKAYDAALPGVPPPKFRKVQRKAILHLARKIVGENSKIMSERLAYDALTEFDDAAISQLRKPLRQMLSIPEMQMPLQTLVTPDPEPDPEMEVLIQVLLTTDSDRAVAARQMLIDAPDDEQDDPPDCTPKPV
jgi:hypothetical protein